MNSIFLETSSFCLVREEYLPDTVYARLQQLLMADPDSGMVMPGCGGLRKLRVADAKRGKGKRGGTRVIYLYVPEAMRFYMIDVYGKDEQEDIPAADKKLFRRIADEIKAEAFAQHKKWQEENQL